MKKRYRSVTGVQYTFPVTVNNRQVWISFKGTENDYITNNTDIQAVIESHEKFRNGEIRLTGPYAKKEKEQTTEINPVKPKEYLGVTNIQGAVEILKATPYHVAARNLRNKEAILSQAREKNICFPEWKI